MDWYYAKDGESRGPVTLDDLRQLVRDGTVRGSDKVWTPAFGGDWRDARTVAELGAAGGTPPAIPSLPASAAFPADPSTPNAELTRRARASLKGNWTTPVLAVFLWQIIATGAGGFIPCIGPVVVLLMTGAISFGFARLFLNTARGATPKIENLFEGFNTFGNTLAAYVLVTIFILLWMLLLIIPGIMASYSYSQVFFILADNPTLPAGEAIKRSKAMMRGRRWKLFCLHCRFIGWALLALVLTFGIGLFWVQTYVQSSLAHFYETVKDA